MFASLLVAVPSLLVAPAGVATGLRMSSPVMQLNQPPQQMQQMQGNQQRTAQQYRSAPVGSTPFGTSSFNGRVVPTRAPTRAPNDPAILVQGGSLRTWSYRSPAIDEVQVEIYTEGRPLDADIELWHGPDNTPIHLRVYVENGAMRPFRTVIATPRGPNTIALRNIGQMEFPFAVNVNHLQIERPSNECLNSATTIQGGALRTYAFETQVDSVQIMLTTDGRPLNARIELLQGPNNNKQVIELYAEDGRDRPFFCVLETPGSGNVVRVVNTAPVEFPMAASVVAHAINTNIERDAVMGGDVVIGGDAMAF
jgi:hypothetical protein